MLPEVQEQSGPSAASSGQRRRYFAKKLILLDDSDTGADEQAIVGKRELIFPENQQLRNLGGKRYLFGLFYSTKGEMN
ncbi:hypothetical protein [Paenibacillus graminis]|uniref:Uncharacterized protein n=1 Tax=Paenibacillus graminis TaxID=189425 RepID=A0A089ME50_9BACL|nr:hypothetical protein [Paenibacillus graminis]AIQ70650.1 hypothetical protein PGRAT_25730 [Paenibacillus graminis]